MKPTRRHFLTGASALSAATLTGLGSSLAAFQASAAETSGYKAIVCLFLFGGMDGHDTLLPYDQSSYNRYAEIRAPLLDLYDNIPGGSTRTRNRLLPLNPTNASDFGSRQFALPEELSGIKGLFDSGNAAVVANVGPIIQPTNRQDFEADNTPQPKSLFSHNDQQSTWVSNRPEGAQFGWGGLFADAALASGANSGSQNFSTVSSFGDDLFLTGFDARPYQVSLGGVPEVEALKFFENDGNASDPNSVYQKLRSHFEGIQSNDSNLINRDIASAMQSALTSNEAFNEAISSLQPFSTQFPASFLGQQLRSVANTIAIRNALLVNRQVFFVAAGGFDTHSGQAEDLPQLHGSIDAAVMAFYQAMQDIGLGSDVTLFTASEFGRTLAINGDGTDHGWGGHQFVIGDAVQGGQIYGEVPPYDFDHDQDAGGGRLIPTTSVEQFAEPLGRWFGLNDSEIAAALPNLSNFGSGLTFV